MESEVLQHKQLLGVGSRHCKLDFCVPTVMKRACGVAAKWFCVLDIEAVTSPVLNKYPTELYL